MSEEEDRSSVSSRLSDHCFPFFTVTSSQACSRQNICLPLPVSKQPLTSYLYTLGGSSPHSPVSFISWKNTTYHSAFCTGQFHGPDPVPKAKSRFSASKAIADDATPRRFLTSCGIFNHFFVIVGFMIPCILPGSCRLRFDPFDLFEGDLSILPCLC